MRRGLRVAVPRALPSAFFRAAPAAPASVRALSSYVPPSETREGRRRKQNFWSKWQGLSQQEFWQDVGFEHDRVNDNRRLGITNPKQKKGFKTKPEFRENLTDDDYFDADDALASAAEYDGEFGDVDADGLFDVDSVLHNGDAIPSPGVRSSMGRTKGAIDALYAQDDVDPARRAELLELLEDLGPESLLSPPPMPHDDVDEASESSELLEQDLSRTLMTTRSFVDSVKLREMGGLADGAYFGYLLNTRRVSKSQAEGKRTSYSTLVVVGNGNGTAGIGMGKDTAAGTSLYKATCAARKNLIHVERFDERTLFHAMDERFAKTKLVVRLRRPGSGTRCSWAVWKILSAFGITDVSVKIHGSRNPTTVAHAVINALQRSTSAQQVADRRGLRVLDMSPDAIRVPGY